MLELEPHQAGASCGASAIGPSRQNDGIRKSRQPVSTRITGIHIELIFLYT